MKQQTGKFIKMTMTFWQVDEDLLFMQNSKIKSVQKKRDSKKEINTFLISFQILHLSYISVNL